MFAIIGFAFLFAALLLISFALIFSLFFGGDDLGPLRGKNLIVWGALAGLVFMAWVGLFEHSPFTVSIKAI